MKKFFILLFSIALMLTACGPKNELQEVRAKLVSLNDSVMVASVEDKEINFEATDLTRNGIVLPHDSVIIHFIGRLNGDCKALLVSILPTAPRVVIPGEDTGLELETREAPVLGNTKDQ